MFTNITKYSIIKEYDKDSSYKNDVITKNY